MTYCVAIAVDKGLIFTSDSRTNAGIDQISTYSKMHQFGIDGQCQFVIMGAGNLATTQAVIKKIRNDIKDNSPINLLHAKSLDEAADYLGELNFSQQNKYAATNISVNHEASFIIGGQIAGRKPGIILVYPQGNYITSSESTLYLQIGESKYGKPILDRILSPETELETAALCSLVSMDSTMRSNLTVGPPIETAIYKTDSFSLQHHKFNEDSSFLRDLNRSWDALMKNAFSQLTPIDF